MKLLWVGDPHATVRELGDVQNLVDYIAQVAEKEGGVDRIHFAGDLYDNFSLVNTQVMAFWKEAFEKLQEFGDVEVLKGNHDMSNDSSSTSHALMAHEEVTVFDHPHFDGKNRILYMPFIRDPVQFVEEATQFKGLIKLVFCHQDFTGAMYENGFYSKEGVDPSVFPPSWKFISGHIHKPYEFGNVWYPGAPRWRTLSDAREQERYLYVFDIEDGEIVATREYPTSKACRRIIEVTLIEDGPDGLNQPLDNNADYRVSITGSEAFVRTTEARVNERLPGAKIAAVIFEESVKLRESEGISTSFQKWFDGFNPPFGTDKDVLRAMVKERVNV